MSDKHFDYLHQKLASLDVVSSSARSFIENIKYNFDDDRVKINEFLEKTAKEIFFPISRIRDRLQKEIMNLKSEEKSIEAEFEEIEK